MKHFLGTILSIVVCAGLLAQPGLGQGNSQGKGKGKGHAREEQQDDRDSGRGRGVQIIFSTQDRDTIHDYYHGSTSNLPPGLAKRRELPPGLRKHLERDGTLPPGLQKRVQPFPYELERRLPPLPADYRRVTIGVDVLILNRKTQRIMDVIHDILRP